MNYWIFRGNNEDFDIESYLKTYKSIYWVAKYPKHQQEMALGDKVFIWRSKGNSKNPYGIVASGEVIELPIDKALVKNPENLGENLWKVADISSIKVGVSVESVRLTLEEGMIDHEFFLSSSTLSSMQLIKARQGTNFKISKEQYELISTVWRGAPVSFEMADPDLEEYGSYEGKTKLILHKTRERDAVLVRKAKEAFFKKHGSIYCEACGVSFKKIFGFDYIEVHHKKPLSKIQSGDVTKVTDLALLCANCHRAVHRIDAVDPFGELLKIFSTSE